MYNLDHIKRHECYINQALTDDIWKSLTMAEEFIINHPAEAKAIVQKRLNYTDEYMATVWPKHQLTLDQSLLIAMER